MEQLRVLIEQGPKKTFASAFDWPGWSRQGKSEDDAIAVLLAYADRLRPVLELGGISRELSQVVEIVDRRPGDAITDFGVPTQIHAMDYEPLTDAERDLQVALLTASWAYFFQVEACVTAELRKGPRGGGRDRDEIVAHVVNADRGYSRKIGVRTPPFAMEPLDRAAFEAHRQAVLAALPACADGQPPVAKGWPLRYALRRMAWHILDHAWEMEDKTLG